MITFNKQRQRKNMCTGGLRARLWALLVLAYRLFERRLEKWKECTMLFAGPGTLKYYPDRRCIALCFHEQKSSFAQFRRKLIRQRGIEKFVKYFLVQRHADIYIGFTISWKCKYRLRFACWILQLWMFHTVYSRCVYSINFFMIQLTDTQKRYKDCV